MNASTQSSVYPHIEQIRIFTDIIENRQEKAKVAVVLCELNCCIRCVWRLLNVHDITFYRKSSQVFHLQNFIDFLLQLKKI